MPKGKNTGSSKQLAEYLDKEKRTCFFDTNNNKVSTERVIDSLDTNVKGLKSKEDKFYMLTFNPSQKELNKIIGRTDVNSFNELTSSEKDKLFSSLNTLTHQCMDNYARAFGREDIKDHKDLVYFSRIEIDREYKHYSEEVVLGSKKVGDLKEGLNVHIHVVVSRKDVRQKRSLSPNSRFKKSTFSQNGENITRGFNYNDFTNSCYKTMCKMIGKNYIPVVSKTGSKELNIDKRVTNKLSSTLKSELTQGNFSTEKDILNKGQKALAFIKACSNPASLTKEVVKEVGRFLVGGGAL